MAASTEKYDAPGEGSLKHAEMVGTAISSHNYDRSPLKIVADIDRVDAITRYRVEAADNGASLSRSSSVNCPHQIVSWEEADLENPYNWSPGRKAWIVFITMLVVVNSTMGSSLPSNAAPFIAANFNIHSDVAEILPISMYLVGYVLGPIFWAPLSEQYGRKWIMLITFIAFTICTLACALAPNWGGLLTFRLLCGVFASSPIALVGGIYADLYDNPVSRGRAIGIFIGGTCVGPLIAPAVSGFTTPAKGWRWTFWIGLMVCGVTWPSLVTLPETYGPELLRQRAVRLRKTSGDTNWYAPIELEEKGWKQLVTVVLTRPIRMFFFEYIVLATCLYLSLAYAIFYTYFATYPIIFEGIYKQSPGVAGLMFVPIGAGVLIATAMFLAYDDYVRRAQLADKPWTAKEEYRRLPLACFGGPMYVIGLFWLGWASRDGTPFWVLMLAGIPFGIGFIIIFMALLNYLTDAYEIYAASAMAAASCCRSIAGAALPFAAPSMYSRLGVPWASSLLGFLSLGMCVIPFLFLWKGDVIRANSTFCTFLREKKEKALGEVERKRCVSGDTNAEEKA